MTNITSIRPIPSKLAPWLRFFNITKTRCSLYRASHEVIHIHHLDTLLRVIPDPMDDDQYHDECTAALYLSRSSGMQVLVPRSFPVYYDPYQFSEYEDGMHLAVWWAHEKDMTGVEWDQFDGLVYTNGDGHVFARDSDKPDSPLYLSSLPMIGEIQKRDDDSLYRPCIPYCAYLEAACDPHYPTHCPPDVSF